VPETKQKGRENAENGWGGSLGVTEAGPWSRESETEAGGNEPGEDISARLDDKYGVLGNIKCCRWRRSLLAPDGRVSSD